MTAVAPEAPAIGSRVVVRAAHDALALLLATRRLVVVLAVDPAAWEPAALTRFVGSVRALVGDRLEIRRAT